MASRSGRAGSFLSAESRQALVMDLVHDERRKLAPVAGDEGCGVCHQDNDHSKMLICEGCNAEYHFYCIGLRAIPTDDWFCTHCKPSSSPGNNNCDGLDLLVAALPPPFTSRFGHIVWAQGGPGYGWWPSYVYDPRRTVGGARELARKNLRKKHLVYFFQCLEAPFAALVDTKICGWVEGIAESHHLGKAAKHSGKQRTTQFGQALKIALLEFAKPLDQRMDWNHPAPGAASPQSSPIKAASAAAAGGSWTPQRRHRRTKKPRPTPTKAGDGIRVSSTRTNCTRTNLEAALAAHNSVNTQDDDLYVRLILCDNNNTPLQGFCRIPHARKRATFSDVRRAIRNQVDDVPEYYRFEIPNLGTVSQKQEVTLGPLWIILIKACQEFDLGDGTIRRPIKVHLRTNKGSE